LFVACISVLIGAAIGLTYGLLSGYIGGTVDATMMRLVDVMLSIPGLLLTLAIVVWLGPGLGTIAIAIAIANVPVFARVARGSVLGLLGSEFVTAARAIGVSDIRMLTRHIMPNSLTPLLVTATIAMGTAIVEAAGLGFLGFGPQDPATPEWGTMLTDTFRYLAVGAGFTALFPGIAIVVTVIGINLLGDSLREALDPRGRK
jgi:peptide/nickel transport system permease protein